MNTIPVNLRDEIFSLFADYCDGNIEPAAGERLEKLLAEHESAKELYVEYLDLHLGLRKLAKQENLALPSTAPPNLLASPRTPVLGFLSRTLANINRPVAWSVMAVAVVFYGSFVLLNIGLLPKQLPDDAAVATVGQSQNVKWSAESAARSATSTLKQGETLRIDAGAVELRLKQGASLVIEGPAQWRIDGQNHATLVMGKLVAHVPRPAIGFTLDTPSTRIVDLGTEFGVDVRSTGGTEVHVLRGLVETMPPPQFSHTAKTLKPVRLSGGQSAFIARLGDSPQSIPASPQKFVRNLSTTPTPIEPHNYLETVLADRPLAYWPLNEPAGAVQIADLSGNGHVGAVRGAVELGIDGPVKQQSATAARFDGASWIELARPEDFSFTSDFTIEAWMRPTPSNTIGRVLSVDSGGHQAGWGFGWLPKSRMANQHAGLLFTLYSVKDYPLAGKPWAADREWHLCTIICDRNCNAHLFVDGAWAATTEGGKPSVAATFRAAIGRQTNGTETYRGDLAHLAVYPWALDERRVRLHFESATIPDNYTQPIPARAANTDEESAN